MTPPAPPDAQTPMPPLAARVLVVDDNPTQAELARLFIAKLGHDVRVAGSVREGLEAARSWRPAAMLLDFELPDGDGFALMRGLAAEAIDCAVIVVTAHASMEAAKDAIRAGAVDYVAKPFRGARLGQVLATALAGRATRLAQTATAPAAADVPRVLVVEDVAAQAELARLLLQKSGYSVRVAASAEQALPELDAWRPDAVLLDVGLPGISGLELLARLCRAPLCPQVIVVTANASSSDAAEAIRLGAFDYIAKPYDAQRLAVTLRNALAAVQRPRQRFHGFIGASAPMQAAYTTIESVAASRASVFITGESGTGKELAAEAIHRASPRAARPFVALNCAAIPRDLLESEVFGHVRGAFTGATADRVGAARLADGGTLFLDEIAEMPLDMQVKLLRFVQTGSFQPVGAARGEHVDVRFVCATNRDPLLEVRQGRFREDLFYRLYVVPLALPPLRERGTDTILIARHFLELFAREEGRGFRGFSAAAEQQLLAYSWPGNVRQLQNVVRRVVVLHDAALVQPAMLPTLPPMLPGPAPATAFATSHQPPPEDQTEIMPLAEMERRLIQAALRRTAHDVPKAAALLQVNPSTIYRKLQAWKAS